MPSFKVQVYCNMRISGSLEVEAASFHEAAQRFSKLPNLNGADWGDSSLEYVVDLITCSDYKLSPGAKALGKEVSVELAWNRNESGDFDLNDVRETVGSADSSLLNQKIDQDSAQARGPARAARGKDRGRL